MKNSQEFKVVIWQKTFLLLQFKISRLFIFVLISKSLDRMTFIFLWRWTIAKKIVKSIMIMMQTKMLKIGITITPHIHIIHKKKFSFPSQNCSFTIMNRSSRNMGCSSKSINDSLCHFWILLLFATLSPLEKCIYLIIFNVSLCFNAINWQQFFCQKKMKMKKYIFHLRNNLDEWSNQFQNAIISQYLITLQGNVIRIKISFEKTGNYFCHGFV